jgi:hypothetical protein
MRRSSPWLECGFAVLGAFLASVYLPVLAPRVTASDGPEILTAVHTLGVVHPTGYPVFTMLAHVFCRLLPATVPPCVKLELFNALAGGGAAFFTALAARQLARALAGSREADLGGLFAGLVMGACPWLVEQVRIPEV